MRATKRDKEEQAISLASIKGNVGIALFFEEFSDSHFYSLSLGTTHRRPRASPILRASLSVFRAYLTEIMERNRHRSRDIQRFYVSAERNGETAGSLLARESGKSTAFISDGEDQPFGNRAYGFHLDGVALCGLGGKHDNALPGQTNDILRNKDRQGQHCAGRCPDDFRVVNIRRLGGQPQRVNIQRCRRADDRPYIGGILQLFPVEAEKP